MKKLLRIVASLPFVFCLVFAEDLSGQIDKTPAPIHLLIGSSFTEGGRMEVRLGNWLSLPRDFYPAANADDAKALKDALEKLEKDSKAQADAQTITQDKESVSDAQATIGNAVRSRSTWRVTELLSGGDTTDVNVSGADYAPSQKIAYVQIARRKEVTLKIELRVYSATGANKDPKWLTLFTGPLNSKSEQFKLDMSKVSSSEITYDLTDVTDAKLIDGTTANLKRLTLDLKHTFGSLPFEINGVGSSNARDLEGKVSVTTTSRYLVDVDRFQTILLGAGYEANELFTNQLVTANLGTRSFLNTVPGVSNFGLAGSRGFVDLSVQEGYWLRQDTLTKQDNAKKAGTWITGQLSIGPNFIGKGDTGFFVNAIGYYFPEKDRSFGLNLNPFEGYIEAGLLLPIGKVDIKNTDANTWVKVALKNGAEKANSFAHAHSFEVTLSKSLTF